MIIFPIILIFLLIILHISISRSSFIITSQQVLLIKIIILLNITILIKHFFLPNMNEFIFHIISFNCLSYSYFHFFNLSDTGRRIKILLMIYGNKNIKNYSSKVMIDNRLVRLQEFGWIMKKRNNYEISKKYPWFIYKILRILKIFS